MALVTAKATGNWSAGSTWDSDPALPASGDTVNCAGYIVTVDQDVTVAQIKSTGAGYFAVSAARTINAAVLSDTGHSGGAVIRCTHATGTVAIIGNVTAGPNVGMSHSAAGTINVTGNVTGGSGANAYGINQTSTGTINITGNLLGGSTSNCRGVHNNSTGTIAITGNATGGAGTTAFGAFNAGAGTVTVSGDVLSGAGSVAHGAANNSTGTLTVGGVCYPSANSGAFGLYGTNSGGTTTFKKAIIGGALGAPVGGYVKLLVDATINYIESVRSDTGAAYKLSNNYPTNAQVESGVVFNLGTQTGSYAGGSTVIVIED